MSGNVYFCNVTTPSNPNVSNQNLQNSNHTQYVVNQGEDEVVDARRLVEQRQKLLNDVERLRAENDSLKVLCNVCTWWVNSHSYRITWVSPPVPWLSLSRHLFNTIPPCLQTAEAMEIKEEEWRESTFHGAEILRQDALPVANQSVLKTSTGTHPFSTTNTLLREGTSLPLTSIVRHLYLTLCVIVFVCLLVAVSQIMCLCYLPAKRTCCQCNFSAHLTFIRLH